jgi:ComEC/Rec2-related protein
MLLQGQPKRRPLIGIALILAGGMLLAARSALQIEIMFLAGSMSLLAAALFFRSKISSLLVFLVAAVIAALRFMIADASFANTSIDRRLDALPISDCEVVGRVSAPPKYYAYKSGSQGMWVFPLCIEGIRESGQWITQSGEIDVRVMGAAETSAAARLGQRVWLKGELQQRQYRGGNPIGMKVAWPRHCTCLAEPRFSLMTWLQKWREAAANHLKPGLEDKPAQRAVLRSLILGYRNEIPADTYACFKRTGSLHIFAISGLHVGIIGLLLAVVLKSVGIPRDWFGIWLVPLLFAYVAATGMKASALRAMVMAAVFLLAPLFRRKPDIPTSVAFAAILLLLLDPHELLSAGFVYSFVVVAFIVMVYAVIPDRWLTGGWVKNYGLSLVITSVAASLASIPMTAYYFGRFSPIALIGNLAVVPLTFCIVLSGWLSILIPPASIVFNHASLVFINAMLWCVESLDQLPGSSFVVDKPPAAAILLWYVSLIYLLVHATRPRQRVYAMGGACAAVLFAVLF